MAPSYSSTYPITGPITYGVSPAVLGGVTRSGPGAPTVAVVSPIANPPSFSLTLVSGSGAPLDTVVGDVLQLGIDAAVATYESSPIDAAAIIAGVITIPNGTLAAGSHTAYARVKRPGTPNLFSDWAVSAQWTQPLVITSSTTFSAPENQTAVGTVVANSVGTYAITGGADSAKFAIGSSTGVLTFLAAPDFEIPGDVGANNVYDLQVTFTRTATGDTVAQNIAVTVLDVTETVGVAVSYTDHAVDSVDRTSYTFASRALGSAATDRNILVAVSSRSFGTAVSSLTIAGVSATLLASSNFNNQYVAIYGAAVPSGTTGDVVVNWGASVGRCGIGVWKMVGAGSLTPSATLTANGSLTVPANGWALGVTSTNGAVDTVWTGLTERYDESVESTVYQSGADAQSVAGGSLSVAFTASGSSSSVVAFAAWGP